MTMIVANAKSDIMILDMSVTSFPLSVGYCGIRCREGGAPPERTPG
jgi:hypothetical protein